LGNDLRPYQIPGGDNDDKSVTLEEVAEKSKEFGLVPYLRPYGNDEIIKKFIASDIPVITRTWLKENDDIGHYRIIKGYDDATKEFIQDDSLQGKNLRYTYDQFDKIWDKFNYEYLVLVPKEKVTLAEQILGEDLDEKIAWQKAVTLSQQKLSENPSDYTAGFNLSVAYYKLGQYQKSVEEFEKVENRLPFRTLWYQIEPILAYYELEEYDRVIQISDKILNYHNRAFSELYVLKGNIYLKRGDKQAARQEFEKAILYNKNLKSAQEALAGLN
jgi:tetratricopeptide (TPR) repeat protein